MSKGINPNLKLKTKSERHLDYYLDGLAAGDRFILSEAITLIESKNIQHRSLGEQILNSIHHNVNTIRIGITGSPGAGKSTFIEALGMMLTALGKKVAVLAVDPSSTKTQGSILGDKTRMSSLSTNKNAFIRPTPSANILGGVARATKETIALCEAAGYDIILIESVGVGQSETDLADLVDLYLLLLLPGGGDGVQGIKRGIVELADLIVINKYDGDRKIIAEQSKKDFSSAIRLFHHEMEGWQVKVELCSALKNIKIGEVWASIEAFISASKQNNFFESKRAFQNQKWIKNQIKIEMMNKAEELFKVDQHLYYEEGKISIFTILQKAKTKILKEYNQYIDNKRSK